MTLFKCEEYRQEYLLRVAHKLDPAVVHFKYEATLMQPDTNLTPPAQNQREGGHHGTIQDESVGRFHLFVKDDVRGVVISTRMQNG